jgi:hypothetical protein
LDLEITQLDFDTAFLNADLEEDIYIQIPFELASEYELDPKRYCYRLRKSLYGGCCECERKGRTHRERYHLPRKSSNAKSNSSQV